MSKKDSSDRRTPERDKDAGRDTMKPRREEDVHADLLSPETTIGRNLQNGQAKNDRSLHEGDVSELSDGGAGSTHLPESK